MSDFNSKYTGIQVEERLDKVDELSGYVDFMSGKNTVSTLVSLPITKRSVVASLSTATALSLLSDLPEGRELMIRCLPSADITQPIPSTGAWTSMTGDSFAAKSGIPFEISIWCYETGKYSIAVMGKK